MSEPLLPESSRNGASGAATRDARGDSSIMRMLQALVRKAPTNGARVAESLDYEPIQNELYFERVRKRKATRHVYGYSGLTLAKNLVVVLTGILTGLVGVVMARGVKFLMEWRNDTIQRMLLDDAPWSPFVFNLLYGVTLTLAAACVVTFWAPSAAGAGVTLVMAYLNGNHIPNLLRARTLVTKVFGAIAGVASGLAIGPEGPMVHIGACIASNITYASCERFAWLWPWATCARGRRADSTAPREEEVEVEEDGHEAPRVQPICSTWEELHEDSEHREFISAGAACGLSAAFGAPIGGVLFSMEEACSFWSKKVAWRCFVACILSAFTVSQLSASGDRGIIVFNGIHTLNNSDWIRQFPLMVLVAAIGGLLGAAFNTLRRALWRVRASRSRKFLRVLEAFAIIAISVGMSYAGIVLFGRCVDVPDGPEGWPDDFKGIRWRCPPGQHNDLATLTLSVPDDVLGRMFSVGHDTELDPGQPIDIAGFSLRALCVWGLNYLIMMALGAGVCVPAGMFMPAIMLGATFGLAVGMKMQEVLPQSMNIQPGLYALICATAALAGVFRSAISLVVLVVEGTRGINFLFGVIVAVVVANFMASFLEHDGVYESEIERDGNVFFLRHEAPHRLAVLTAGEIMVPNPVCFPTIVQVKEVLRVLQSTTHHGFPVVKLGDTVRRDGDLEGVGQLEGLVLRSQLLVLLRERAFCNSEGQALQRELGHKGRQYFIERSMRLFYRRSYTHHRYMATRDPLISSLNSRLDDGSQAQALEEGQGGPSGGRAAGLPSIAEGAATEAGHGEDAPKMTGMPAGAFAANGHGGAAGAGDRGDGGEAPFSKVGVDDTAQASEITVLKDELEGEATRVRDELDELMAIMRTVPSSDHLYIDLRPYMNTAPLTVRKEMSAARVHRTFVTLGMRHLCVVSSSNRVVGIVTRKDLEIAATHGVAPPRRDEDAPLLHSTHSVIASSSKAQLKKFGFFTSLSGQLYSAGLSSHYSGLVAHPTETMESDVINEAEDDAPVPQGGAPDVQPPLTPEPEGANGGRK